MVDIQEKSRDNWRTVATKVNKAAVFMDNACAECLHWNGGATLLYNAGALDVKEFSSFESGRSEERKAVFVLSAALHGTTMEIIQDILRASSFQYVIIICSLSQGMHTIVNYGKGHDDTKTFIDAEEQLLEWMGNMNYTVEISYLPVLVSPVTPDLFVLPTHANDFPLLPSDLDTLLPTIAAHNKGAGSITDLDYMHLPKELQLSLKLLVCSLNSVLESLEISEDIYGLGHTSRMVASELAGLPWAKQRRKNAKQKASIVIVDRTLDIANVVGHHWETMLDRILELLPKLPGHGTDVCVNMAPICSVKSDKASPVIVPGCLAHPDDDVAASILHTLATIKQKEAMMEVNRQLVEAASKDNLPIKLTGRPGRVTAEQLDNHLSHYKGNGKLVRRNKGLLQMCMGVVESLRHSDSARLDSLLGVEKGIVQSIGDEDGPSPLKQLLNTLDRETQLPENERLYKLEDIFLLMVFLYSILDEQEDVEFVSDERKLQESITKSILMGKDNLPDFLKDLVGEDAQKDTVFLIVQDLFEKLRCLSRTREDMQQFDAIHEAGSMTSQACLKPLLKTVMDAVFDPNKPELQDLVYKSTGFRDLLKSGFGLFMNVSKPRPSDQPLLIVFIIGGTTSTEVRQIKEAASKAKIQVMVGSTKLLSPTDLLQQIFVKDHLHPKQ